jgi:Mg-chelatase subunit ChlD
MNHVRVIAYFDSLERVVSVPSSRNHAAHAKVIIDNARYGEHKPFVDMDVVVHFANNAFDGDSFGLALALADKCARYGITAQTGRVVATGGIGPQGEVTAVGAFPEKVTYLRRVLQSGDVFVYPTGNATEPAVQAALRQLRRRGIVLRAVKSVEEVRDLWTDKTNNAPSGEAKQGAVTMPYGAQISRAHPSCLLFLIDQSGSMSDPVGGEPGRSKAERLADAINRLLYELVIRCTKDQTEGIRNYYDIGVIGYGSRVGPALGGLLAGRDLVPVPEVGDNPARVEDRHRKIEDGAGGLIEQTVKFAIWFDPVANGGTPMCQALQQARGILQSWVQNHPTSFPPIVINITDGEATDGDPRSPAEDIRALATQDGNVLLFNLHLSSRAGEPVLYPESEAGLSDQFARQLFEMSSPLPPHIRAAAQSAGYAVGPQPRGFAFNADMVEVIKFLDIGTRAELR